MHALRQAGEGDRAHQQTLTVRVLSKHGYEPRRINGEIELANCPFHALAEVGAPPACGGQTELACNMNHALITGVADALAPHGPDARLCPGADRCCVVLKRGGE
jgi:predicted ArsR family transcriptional regulator